MNFGLEEGCARWLRRFMAESKRNAEGRRPQRGALRLIGSENIRKCSPAGNGALMVSLRVYLRALRCLRVSLLLNLQESPTIENVVDVAMGRREGDEI